MYLKKNRNRLTGIDVILHVRRLVLRIANKVQRRNFRANNNFISSNIYWGLPNTCLTYTWP